MNRKRREKPFADCTPVEKLERLLEAFPELTQPFVDQMDSIWCLRTSNELADFRRQVEDEEKAGAA